MGGGLGNDPVEVGNGYVAWQKDGKVQRRALTGGEVVAVRDQLPTGISRILADGSVKMKDEDRTALNAISPSYADPSWAGDMTVGEDNDNGVVYFFNNNLNSLSRIWQGITTLNPKAAADGSGNYAVAAWSDRRGGETVRVAVVKKGTTSTPTSQSNPSAAVDATPGWLGDLAFDTKNNKWLVVSKHDGPIYGRIMGNDGNAITDVFKISSDELTGGWSPLVAYSKDADKFLVVWVDYSNGWNLYGRFVSSDKSMGNQFKINSVNPYMNIGGDRTSSIQYDSKNKKFVIIWENREGRHSAVFTTIELDGKQGPSVELTDGENSGINGPSIAVNEDKNE